MTLSTAAAPASDVRAATWDPVEQTKNRCGASVGGDAYYRSLTAMGLDYGPAFRGIQEIWIGEAEALARVRAPASTRSSKDAFHPAVLDACLHTCLAAVADVGPGLGVIFGGFTSFRLHKALSAEIFCQARWRGGSTHEGLPVDVRIVDSAGELVGEVSGVTVRLVPGATADAAREQPFYEIRWQVTAPPPMPLHRAIDERWLILSDDSGTGAAIAERLSERGIACTQLLLDGNNLDQAEAIFTRCLSESDQWPWGAIVHAWSLDAVVPEDAPTEELERWHERLLRATSALLRTLSKVELARPPRLWILTRGAQPVRTRLNMAALAQAPLIGFARTIAYEHPELMCTRVDVDPGSEPNVNALAVMRELLSEHREDEIALRGDQRLVARLDRLAGNPSTTLSAARDRPFKLQAQKSTVPAHWSWQEQEAPSPGPGEVLVTVEHGALARHTVWRSADADHWPSAPPSLVAIAGTISAVGEGILESRVGEAVVAFGPAVPSTHVAVAGVSALRRPTRLSSEQAAATCPLVAAHHGLHDVARLRSGERVLVQGPLNALSFAVAQVARHLGAEVTVVSPSDDDVLRARLQALGATILHSGTGSARPAASFDMVVLCGSGRGPIDAVRALAPTGRMLALGPALLFLRESWTELQSLLAGAPLMAVDLQTLYEHHPDRFRRSAEAVFDLLERGQLAPVDVIVQRAGELSVKGFEAGDRQSHGEHRVIAFVDPEAAIVRRKQSVTIRSDGSYVIVGGLGGFGLTVASWLVANGAGSVVLVGRSGATTEGQKRAVDELRAHGATVTVVQADLSQRSHVERLLRELKPLPRLRGIIQSAALLRDGLIVEQDWQAFVDVLRPKIAASMLLHELTREEQLDFFLLFSSASGLLGTPAQANYAAGNTFVDALAHYRTGAGLPGMSIAWGLLGDVGLGADVERRGGRMTARGFEPISPPQAMELLEQLLSIQPVHVGAMEFNVHRWVDFNPQVAGSSYLKDLRAKETQSKGVDETRLREQLSNVPAYERAELLRRIVAEQVAAVLRLPVDEVGPSTPFTNMGLDSLMALELRNRLESQLGHRFSAALLWKYPHLDALVDFLRKQTLDEGQEAAALQSADEPKEAVETWETASTLDDLSDDEAEALLDQALSSIQDKLR